VPQEEGLTLIVGALHEVDQPSEQIIFDRLHAFSGQWPAVLDGLLADPAEPVVHGRVVNG
jgi:hypothetical protein